MKVVLYCFCETSTWLCVSDLRTNVCVFFVDRVTGGELFDEIVAREFYSEHDARCVPTDMLCQGCSSQAE